MEERNTGIEEEKKDIMTTMINVNIAREADCSMLAALGGWSLSCQFRVHARCVYTLDISAMDDRVVVVVVRRKTKKAKKPKNDCSSVSSERCRLYDEEEEEEERKKTRTIPNATLILRIHTIPFFFLRYYPADDLMLHIEKRRSHQRMQE